MTAGLELEAWTENSSSPQFLDVLRPYGDGFSSKSEDGLRIRILSSFLELIGNELALLVVTDFLFRDLKILDGLGFRTCLSGVEESGCAFFRCRL